MIRAELPSQYNAIPGAIRDYLDPDARYPHDLHVSKREPIIRAIVPHLEQFIKDYQRKNPALYLRAHHQRSMGAIMHFAHARRFMVSPESFFENGIQPTPRLLRFTAECSIRLYDSLRNDTTGRSRKNVQGTTTPYFTDRYGLTTDTILRHIIEESKTMLPPLIQPGSTILSLGAYPDNRCRACAIGAHCTVHTLRSPTSKEQFDPVDVGYIVRYLSSVHRAVILESHPLDAFSNEDITRYQLKNLVYDNQIPVVVTTPLADFRRFVWNSSPTEKRSTA